MTDRLEAVIEWLGRRSLRAQILGIFLDCIVLDTLEDELLDEVGPEERTPIAVPNALPVIMLVEVFVLEGDATVQMRVELDDPGRSYLGEGPAFVIGRDGSRDPTDDWEAGWR